MARTQIPGTQITDHSIADTDVAANAAILGSKLSISYVGATMATTASSESVLGIDASLNPVTINLPSAIGLNGRLYNIKKIDPSANLVTVDAYGDETIDGNLTIEIGYQNACISIVSTGSNWVVI